MYIKYYINRTQSFAKEFEYITDYDRRKESSEINFQAELNFGILRGMYTNCSMIYMFAQKKFNILLTVIVKIGLLYQDNKRQNILEVLERASIFHNLCATHGFPYLLLLLFTSED